MKKYIVKLKDSEKIFGEFNSRKEASIELMKYINDVNKDLDSSFISPFDYEIEVIEYEVNEAITDFETARKVLGFNPNDDFTIIRKKHFKNIIRLEDVARLVFDINPKHIEALIALNELFTIAEAWNKEDGFVPDFSDWNQAKWYPWFIYDKDAAGFVFATTGNTPSYAAAYFGSRLCFKTNERAAQFGKQFTDLYNKVFLP